MEREITFCPTVVPSAFWVHTVITASPQAIPGYYLDNLALLSDDTGTRVPDKPDRILPGQRASSERVRCSQLLSLELLFPEHEYLALGLE